MNVRIAIVVCVLVQFLALLSGCAGTQVRAATRYSVYVTLGAMTDTNGFNGISQVSYSDALDVEIQGDRLVTTRDCSGSWKLCLYGDYLHFVLPKQSSSAGGEWAHGESKFRIVSRVSIRSDEVLVVEERNIEGQVRSTIIYSDTRGVIAFTLGYGTDTRRTYSLISAVGVGAHAK
jgi:hypothetical protein